MYIYVCMYVYIYRMFGAYLFMTVVAALLINWIFNHYIIFYFILSSALTLNSILCYITISAFGLFASAWLTPLFSTFPNLSALPLHLTLELLGELDPFTFN